MARRAVRHDGYALRYAHADLRADKEVVLEAVRRAAELSSTIILG